jgi:hypothetical protein
MGFDLRRSFRPHPAFLSADPARCAGLKCGRTFGAELRPGRTNLRSEMDQTFFRFPHDTPEEVRTVVQKEMSVKGCARAVVAL